MFSPHCVLGSACPKVLWMLGNSKPGPGATWWSANHRVSWNRSLRHHAPLERTFNEQPLGAGPRARAGLLLLFRGHSFQSGHGPLSLVFPFLTSLTQTPPKPACSAGSLGKRPKSNSWPGCLIPGRYHWVSWHGTGSGRGARRGPWPLSPRAQHSSEPSAGCGVTTTACVLRGGWDKASAPTLQACVSTKGCP